MGLASGKGPRRRLPEAVAPRGLEGAGFAGVGVATRWAGVSGGSSSARSMAAQGAEERHPAGGRQDRKGGRCAGRGGASSVWTAGEGPCWGGRVDSQGGGRRCGSLEKLGKQTPICPLLLDAHAASGPWVAAPESGGAGGGSLQGRRPVWVQQPRLWVGGSPGAPVPLGIRVGLGLQLRGWGEPSGPHRLKPPGRVVGFHPELPRHSHARAHT